MDERTFLSCALICTKNLKKMDEWEAETMSVAPYAKMKDDLLDIVQK